MCSPLWPREEASTAFLLLYNGADAGRIGASYQAARQALGVNNRQNIDAVWDGGLSAWNTAPLVYLGGDESDPASWDPACVRNGQPDRGLCDTLTRKILISGNWARTVAAYGATQNQPIQRGTSTSDIAGTGFVGLLHVLAEADTDLARRADIHSLAQDIALTAIEPAP